MSKAHWLTTFPFALIASLANQSISASTKTSVLKGKQNDIKQERSNINPEKVKTRYPKLNLSGNVVIGSEYRDEFYSSNQESQSNLFLRRAKLKGEYHWSKHWDAELELTISDKSVRDKSGNIDFALDDAYLAYQNLQFDQVKIGNLKIGHMKEPFGFERQTGLTKLLTNERSLTSSALTPGRSYGILLGRNKKQWTWALGYFWDKASSTTSKGVSAKAARLFQLSDYHKFHFGLSLSQKHFTETEFQIKARASLFSADNIIRSAKFSPDRSKSAGIEFLWQFKSLNLVAESIAQSITQSTGHSWNYSGYYIQVGYFLSGDNINYRKGKLGSIEPESSSGAWQLTARYNFTDLRDSDINGNSIGSETSISELGLNYYYKKNTIIKFNYQRAILEGNSLGPQDNGDGLSIRLIYKY